MSDLNLAGLLPLISQIPGYARLLADLRAGRATTLTLLEAARPFVFAALQRDLGHPVLIVTDEPERARQLQAQIRLWSVQPGGVLLFPEPDALPYERVAWSAETISQRLAVLTTLSTPHASRIPHQHPIIIASARAIVQKTIPRQAFASASRPFRQGDRVDLTDTLALLYDLGYEPGSVVESPGTSSRRGGIIDVYPPATESPVRIEFFGNEIESIRPFDPLTQRSQGRLHTATITPGNEALLTRGPHAARELARLDVSTCHPLAQSDFRRAIEALEHSQPFHGRELFLQYLYTQPGMLLDYLPSDGVLILEEAGEIEAALREVEDHAALVRDDLVKGSELPEGFLTPHFGADRVWGQLSARPGLRLSYAPGSKHDDVGSAFLAAPHYGGQLQDALKESLAARRDGPVVMVTRQAQRLSELLAEDDVFIAPVEQVDALPVSGSLTLVQGALAEGWKIAFGSQQSAVSGSLLLLTDTEIFGWRMPQPRRARRRPAITTPEAFFSDLKVGDYVVHIDYGIGLFQGLIKLVIPGSEREYLQVDYAGEDRLYVPVHQTDRLSRYVGASDHPPFLSRLGTADWEHIKERTSAAVADIAQELLDLYAAREVVSGHAFSPDPPWQAELEASFPYSETEDQLAAIEAVKLDMEQPKPMDRLICGDVGYGKTEVALRAAFKAVLDGKQVAVLVPTTVLAQQHFNTFRERLAPFPVVVEMLSRFRSTKGQRDIIDRLREGKIDIVIGTHRLLQKDVTFKNLGLLIIDEEQRFGVAHKERLKAMRKEVDVLTLTATPIPRTLYLSLSGVRDMSSIDTPPEDRLPIVTYVGEYDEAMVRQAILRELDRGGQVYYVFNRIEGIDHAAFRLSKLVPEVSLAVAHGQMDEGDLERIMLNFASGGIDVLVCTSIIESGLDIPNCNTLIIDGAEHFGLAQLYQLRGRVGRSSKRAYAYFLYRHGHHLTDTARKRLQTILEASELGAGFHIAMRDLEIRGAGDILGARQHGHISAVGFDLYCRLLAQAVRELREKKETKVSEEKKEALIPSFPSIDLPLEAYLPEDYVPDEALRLRLYRRMGEITTVVQAEEMGKELEDRFGELPRAARDLMFLLRLKALAIAAGVESIAGQGDRIVVRWRPDGPVDRRRLEEAFGSGVQVGRGQFSLPLERGWREELVQGLKMAIDYQAKAVG